MAEIVQMLALSPTMEEGLLVGWSKSEGDSVAEGDVIAEIETDKATMEMESFFDGTVLKLLVEAGNTVKVGDPIAIIGDQGEDIESVLAKISNGGSGAATPAAPAKSEPDAAPSATTTSRPESRPRSDGERIFATPVARKIAAEAGLDLADIDGSGPRGRIIKADVEAAVASGRRAPSTAPTAPGGESIALTPMRKTIARRMTESWTTAPHFMLTTEVDMGPVAELRSRMNSELKAAEAGIKLSFNDFVIKAAALGLREVPSMNVAWGGDHIIQHDEVHIGVAVALDGGLITPVVRHADKLTLGAISKSVRDLAGRARDKKLSPDEYTGSTFSVSNLGMFGVTEFSAVLNPPEAGIIAVGAIVDKPVVVDGAIAVGKRMNVTLSCDHRSTDGALGAQLLAAIRRLLENPVLLAV